MAHKTPLVTIYCIVYKNGDNLLQEAVFRKKNLTWAWTDFSQRDWAEARKRLDEAIQQMNVEAVRDNALSLGRLADVNPPHKVLRKSFLHPHCKDKIPKFRNKYSQKRNIGVSVPISTFMRLWVIYIFPQLVCLFCWRKYVDRSWEYINRSQTHECRNWGWGHTIPRKGIHKWDFRCSAHIFIFQSGIFY
jgi:hypothetical protein